MIAVKKGSRSRPSKNGKNNRIKRKKGRNSTMYMKRQVIMKTSL
jgi:hypothetical protein